MVGSFFFLTDISSIAAQCKDGGRDSLMKASFHRKYLQGRLQVLAGTVARTCVEGCTYLRGRMQYAAWRDAVHCVDGCSALRERLQCTASEMGKRGTEIASPILDKRKGR